MTLRRRLFDVLEGTPDGGRAGRVFGVAMMTLIALNVVVLALETVEAVHRWGPALFYWFEVASVLVFSAEYVARVWACVEDPRYRRPVVGRLRFALSAMAVADLLAVVPFYLPLLGVDLRALRTIRLMRVFRMAKLVRYSNSLRVLAQVFREKRPELLMVLSMGLLLLVMSSSTLYFVEREAQPEVFSSIPAALWWGVATLTTVGYGDIYPVTFLGKAIAAVISIMGIGMFALPAGILASGFMDVMKERRAVTGAEDVAEGGEPVRVIGGQGGCVCPRCGLRLEGGIPVERRASS